MQETTILNVILRNTFTRADFYRRVDFLREVFERQFFDPNAHEHDLARVVRSFRGDDLAVGLADRDAIVAWGEEVLSSFDRENMQRRMLELKRAADALPKFTLYVPVILSPMHVSSLGAWCRANVQGDVLLDMRVDSSATGGCTFAYGSSLHDFSLSYFIRKERPALMRLVRAYGE